MRRILVEVFWCCAVLLLAACAQEPTTMTEFEPAPDRSLTLANGEKAALIANAESRDNADIPACVREKLLEAMPGLQLVQPSEFRSIQGLRFSPTPMGIAEVNTALAEAPVQSGARRLALRHLIIISGQTDERPGVPHAYTYAERHSYVGAKFWDVPAAKLVGEFGVHVWGTFETFFVPVAYTPTERAACERMAELMAKRMS